VQALLSIARSLKVPTAQLVRDDASKSKVEGLMTKLSPMWVPGSTSFHFRDQVGVYMGKRFPIQKVGLLCVQETTEVSHFGGPPDSSSESLRFLICLLGGCQSCV